MRLIDKDSLLEQFKIKNTEELKFDGSIESICRVYFDKLANMFIEKAPEIDATPVKHGKWIPVINFGDIKGYNRRVCSVCEANFDSPYSKAEKYCSNCGAKMDLEG